MVYAFKIEKHIPQYTLWTAGSKIEKVRLSLTKYPSEGVWLNLDLWIVIEWLRLSRRWEREWPAHHRRPGRRRHGQNQRFLARVCELSAAVHQKRNRGHGEIEGVNANSPRRLLRPERAWKSRTSRDGRWMSSCKVRRPLGKVRVRQRAKTTARWLRRGDA